VLPLWVTAEAGTSSLFTMNSMCLLGSVLSRSVHVKVRELEIHASGDTGLRLSATNKQHKYKQLLNEEASTCVLINISLNKDKHLSNIGKIHQPHR